MTSASRTTRAVMLGQNPDFRLYLDHAVRARKGLTHDVVPDGTHSETDAADFIRKACGVDSRARLDSSHSAAQMFDRIVIDYQAWKRRQGRAGR